MFQVDRLGNRLQRIDAARFSDENLRERSHLQEWIAHQPDALGEDLLILAKEFDGFADTRERLDLLALDKDGRLVVIENKLDDSGRDVTWQALKYTAYVSSLTKAQIVDVFQAHLNAHGGGTATEKLQEFLETEDWNEVVLNPGHEQRLIFVAANFRKEVTSTVLWLREHRIDARCIRVTPYRYGEDLLVDFQQVIPTPEAREYMIGMAEKDSEAQTENSRKQQVFDIRRNFWEQLLEQFRARGLERWQNVSPSKDHWLNSAIGAAGCSITLIFSRKEIRVELQLNRPNAEENKALFDLLLRDRAAYDAKIGTRLDWRRMDDKKVSIVSCAREVPAYTRENWSDSIDWLQARYVEIEEAFGNELRRLSLQIKSGEIV